MILAIRSSSDGHTYRYGAERCTGRLIWSYASPEIYEVEKVLGVRPRRLSVVTGRGPGQNPVMAEPLEATEYVRVGPREFLDRFLEEYGLAAAKVQNAIMMRTPVGTGGVPGPPEYLIHRSLLRSHHPFPCADDTRALNFCHKVADEITMMSGVAQQEAVALVNRFWSDPGRDGRTPRIWIVGLAIAYHHMAHDWASLILTTAQ